MRTIFLVDTENVANRALKYCELVGEKDKIYLFIGVANVMVSLADALKIRESKASNIEIVQCISNGNNALDFQLSSYLGYLIKGAPKTNYAIISDDNGYKPLITFWEQRGTRVGVYQDIKKAIEDFQNTDEHTEDNIHLSTDEVLDYNLALQRNKSLLGNVIRDKNTRNKVAELLYDLEYIKINNLLDYGVSKLELKKIKENWDSFKRKSKRVKDIKISN